MLRTIIGHLDRHRSSVVHLVKHPKVHHHSFRLAMIAEAMHALGMLTKLDSLEAVIPVVAAFSMIAMHLSGE